jgi:hypothetical protein
LLKETAEDRHRQKQQQTYSRWPQKASVL